MLEQDVNQVPVEDLTPEQASHIIHSHRKVRYGTACWPCRQRKVKCTNDLPCENCIKREHPQLCSYKPNRSSASKQVSISAGSNLGKKRAHSPDASSDNAQEGDRQPDGWRQAIDQTESNNELNRYVGQNSIPALLRDQPSPIETKDGVDIRRDMRPIFGLDTSAPFPLMSAKHLDMMMQDIFSELPPDREVMILFNAYKDIAHPFWSFVADIDDLESRIIIYLEERAKSSRDTNKPGRPVSASWLAILFAVMAVGSQYRDSPYHIRTRDSQKYVQISFHFLRMGNFLLRPNLDSIQALLLTGFVLLNDMKAEASWAIIGMTCRLAQSLGLHRTITHDDTNPNEPSSKSFVRRKLWWTCQWHDTLTSLSFDRPNMTNIPCCPIPITPSPLVEGLSYIEMMYRLCELISKRLNPDATAEYTYQMIMDNVQAVESLRGMVYPQLRSKEACKSVLDKLQHYATRLHTSFVVSVCCRPALRRDFARLTPSEQKTLSDMCKANLTETVRMFLAMHQLSFIPTRSWAFTYHGLSSAVLLGILNETKQDREIRQLHGDLIAALSAATAKEQDSPSPEHIRKTDKDIELSGPLSRALAALRNIYDYGTLHGVSGMKSESASGTRTPVNFSAAPNLQISNPQNRLQLGHNRHQDAALAMTELQNSTPLQEYPNPMTYQPHMATPVGLPDLSQIDPSTLAPMELYDSIFWGQSLSSFAPQSMLILTESPDPFYNGADMSFDFLPRTGPGQAGQHYYF
ncbi:fungal-specific transcription factor domain-containing protein [Hypoxylon argillaceum]|nr:fungal-specific transcription factor domain-containing protein [Hypoxylon argillaceum]KAI1154545.1 fungal-specific transcription factor domain-containing protein [Nemania diffusa]